MNILRITLSIVLGLFVATASLAAPLKLKPANPQPGGLKPGLSVRYAWGGNPPGKINAISSAKSVLASSGKPGKPLRGLDYRDTDVGDPVLTYNQHFNVAADITGYMRFDGPGIYEIETWSNDGIDAFLSGESIGQVLGRQGCEPNQRVAVEIPRAGWYDLKITYFQKYGTACLMMKWGKNGGAMNWVPNNVFGRK